MQTHFAGVPLANVAGALLRVIAVTSGGSGRWGRRVDYSISSLTTERVEFRKRDVDRAGRRGLLVAGDQRRFSAFDGAVLGDAARSERCPRGCSISRGCAMERSALSQNFGGVGWIQDNHVRPFG
jgi:hypothetical protein